MFTLFDGKIVLITGGTGSFAHALIDRIINTGVKQIRILSRDEKKQDDMRRNYQNSKLKYYIGDIRDLSSIEDAFKDVDYVFSTAALKQVPSCEFFPIEAVKTNVIGQNNVITASIRNKVKKVVFCSTDKACYPVNAMGMSKALMEKNIIARSRELTDGETTLCITRFGNVMASRGSVIPLFLKQINGGKPLTITNPEMTRFMMTLDDAIDLVLYAFENGKRGETYVQKAPATTIDTLAKAVLKITNSNTGVSYIGTRHGEKTFETLITEEEMTTTIDLGDFYCIKPNENDLNYEEHISKTNETSDQRLLPYTSSNTKLMSVDEMVEMLKRLSLFGGQITVI